MVKRKSRPQTHTAIIVGAETELVCGSENYSGTKIPWAEMPVRVRISSKAPIKLEWWQMLSLRRTENPQELDRNQPAPLILFRNEKDDS